MVIANNEIHFLFLLLIFLIHKIYPNALFNLLVSKSMFEYVLFLNIIIMSTEMSYFTHICQLYLI